MKNKITQKIAALCCAIFLAFGVNIATSSPAAAASSVYHSNHPNSYGPLKVTCNGGAVHTVYVHNYSPCSNTVRVEPSWPYAFVSCHLGGVWKSASYFNLGAGSTNCRTQYIY